MLRSGVTVGQDQVRVERSPCKLEVAVRSTRPQSRRSSRWCSLVVRSGTSDRFPRRAHLVGEPDRDPRSFTGGCSSTAFSPARRISPSRRSRSSRPTTRPPAPSSGPTPARCLKRDPDEPAGCTTRSPRRMRIPPEPPIIMPTSPLCSPHSQELPIPHRHKTKVGIKGKTGREGRRSNPHLVWKLIRELHARRYG